MDHSFSSSTRVEDATDDFYAELTRQILLLTDEDDDDDEVQVKKKGGRRFNYNQRYLVGGGRSLMPGNYFLSWSESKGGEIEVPGWMERLWAAKGGAGTGTGVFIPRVQHKSASRKRNNKSKKNLES